MLRIFGRTEKQEAALQLGIEFQRLLAHVDAVVIEAADNGVFTRCETVVETKFIEVVFEIANVLNF